MCIDHWPKRYKPSDPTNRTSVQNLASEVVWGWYPSRTNCMWSSDGSNASSSVIWTSYLYVSAANTTFSLSCIIFIQSVCFLVRYMYAYVYMHIMCPFRVYFENFI